MSYLNYPDLLEKLLQKRGILPDERDCFLNPDYKMLHDPILLPDMEKARDRVISAINNSEHIAIYSDYDADGIPGAVVLSDFFNRIKYENVSYYIPHRHDEGYGLNLEAIDTIKERGAKLIITVDCGISDCDEISYANSIGIEVIITDHHLPKSKFPDAYAIVNPKRPDSIYPFNELCGAAIAYKLIQAILTKKNFGLKAGIEKWSLDMVGIATLSDMVPLVGENRILARFGLEVLRKTPRPGLQAIFKKININQKFITEDDIGYMITPRINAASRMGIPEDAFRLLSAKNQIEAEQLANHLEKINRERKGLVASMVKEAKKHLSGRENISKVLVIGNPEWRPSLLGLIANSLAEEYERPVFVWGKDGDGGIKGSCRTYNGYNLHELMTLAKDSFTEYGGHKGAGGFSISLESLITLENKLSDLLDLIESDQQQESKYLMLTQEVSLDDINDSLWETISLLAPFGISNEKPILRLSGVPVRSIKTFGKSGEHLEITLGNGIKAISFFSKPENHNLNQESSLRTLYAHIEKSYFRNKHEIRLRIISVEI